MKQNGYLILLICTLVCMACGEPNNALVIREQGSFFVGGTVKTEQGVYDTHHALEPNGQTLHGDHAYVSYQIPTNAREYPLVFLHGSGQSAKTWETTPDGREGFSNIFLRRGFGIYLIDQPRRGRAGRGMESGQINSTPDDQFWYETFRIGVWPDYYEGSQFPRQPEALEQFFRQMTPDTAPYDEQVVSDAVAALFDKIGGGILVTHSQGGGPGWHTAIKSKNVRAIVSYEPGSGFVFPEGEVPDSLPTINPLGALTANVVSLAEFERLTRIPIVIYYGDNIPAEPSDVWGQDGWRVRMQMARLFAECINRHGGDASVVYLPDVGLHGNTHFPMSDLNNTQVADLLSEWFKRKELDEK